MATNRISFKDRKTTRKGKVGENIVRQYLEKRGWVIYEPQTDCAHAFDKVAIKDKNKMALLEVKTKARRNFYPDTGIDIRHYMEYKTLSEKYNLPIFLFFVDEMMALIYGNKLSFLEERVKTNDGIEYPLKQKGIIYFPLERMKKIAILDAKTVLSIKKLNTRSYEYLET